jgi:hypothetical protein
MGAFDQMMQLELVNDPSAGDQKPLKVECIDALSGELTLQSPGVNSCKGEALVAIHTDGAGELPYELECGPGKSWQRKVTAMANKIGVDKVRFDVANNEQVTCSLRTRIGGKLKPLDGASMTFTCHKPIDTGADDLAPETRPEDRRPWARRSPGDFTFVDAGGTICPRQGKALINFKTSKPDNVHYSLDCTNGHFSGVAQTAPSPQGGFIAPALVSFGINQTTHAKCALKTVAPGKPKVHTLKGHTFQCVRTTGVDSSDDLAPDTRPDPQKPEGPGKIVIDPPRETNEPTIACAGGTVKDGACAFERTMKPVKAGKNAWRCVKVAVDPKPDRPSVSEPKISCGGGTGQERRLRLRPRRKAGQGRQERLALRQSFRERSATEQRRRQQARRQGQGPQQVGEDRQDQGRRFQPLVTLEAALTSKARAPAVRSRGREVARGGGRGPRGRPSP